MNHRLRLLGMSLMLLCTMGAAPSRTKTYVSGTIISPTDVTENEDNIFSYLQAGVDTLRAGAVSSASILDGTIANADISSSAAIAYSKLNLTSSVTNSDLATVQFKVKVGTFTRDTSTASGTQAVTGVGFTPKTIIFLSGVDSDDESSWGIDDGTTGKAIGDRNGAGTNTWTIPTGNVSIEDVESSGNTYEGVVTAFGSDGFTVTWTKTGSPTGTLTIAYLAMG